MWSNSDSLLSSGNIPHIACSCNLADLRTNGNGDLGSARNNFVFSFLEYWSGTDSRSFWVILGHIGSYGVKWGHMVESMKREKLLVPIEQLFRKRPIAASDYWAKWSIQCELSKCMFGKDFFFKNWCDTERRKWRNTDKNYTFMVFSTQSSNQARNISSQ